MVVCLVFVLGYKVVIFVNNLFICLICCVFGILWLVMISIFFVMVVVLFLFKDIVNFVVKVKGCCVYVGIIEVLLMKWCMFVVIVKCFILKLLGMVLVVIKLSVFCVLIVFFF